MAAGAVVLDEGEDADLPGVGGGGSIRCGRARPNGRSGAWISSSSVSASVSVESQILATCSSCSGSPVECEVAASACADAPSNAASIVGGTSSYASPAMLLNCSCRSLTLSCSKSAL